MSKPFKASRKSHCHLCDSSIVPGEHITWPRRGDDRRWRHAHCNLPCNCEDTPEAEQPAYQSSLSLNGASHAASGGAVNATASANGAAAAVSALASVIEPLIASRVPAMDAIRDLVQDEIQAALAALPEPEPHRELIEVRTPIGEIKQVGRAHKQFKRLLALVAQRKDTYLYGAAGGGKSTAVRQCAEALSLEYSTISLNVQTTESKIAGYMDANGRYVEPLFRVRYEKGGVYFVDETDNAAGNLLTSLNTALANGHYAFPDGMVARHPDFVCIGAGNTAGRGASRQHAERRQFDSAFSDRFFFMKWDYDEELERDAALAYGDAAKPWVEWVRRVRAHCAEQNLHHVSVTPRASIEGAKLIAAGFDVDRELADGLVFKGLEASQVNGILRDCPLPA